jgi:putative peptidoglycan lipid II flippase
LHKVLQPLFYAREDSRSPFYYAVISMITNAVMAVGMMPLIGFAAAAWATTLSGWIMVWQLWHGSRTMGEEAHFDARFKQRMPRIVVASAVMGGVLYGAAWATEPLLHQHLWRYLALLAICTLGIVTYFGCGAAIGAFRLSDFAALRRRPRADAKD